MYTRRFEGASVDVAQGDQPLTVTPSCVAASWKGHRRPQEEDLGHVRPPDPAGGEWAEHRERAD